jgi:hypothetical protein
MMLEALQDPFRAGFWHCCSGMIPLMLTIFLDEYLFYTRWLNRSTKPVEDGVCMKHTSFYCVFSLSAIDDD